MTNNSYRYSVDFTSTSAAVAVAEAISDITNRDINDLPPLHTAIDTDALDSLFDPTRGSPASSLRLEFTYMGFRVVMGHTGDLVIHREADD